MATPLLIDVDMGVDDAVAVALALASPAFDVRAIVAVGGSVEADQVVVNIGRLLKALNTPTRPRVGKGLDQSGPDLVDRREMFGDDGLGQCGLPPDDALEAADFKQVYRETIEAAAGKLVIITTGPLSNLAAVLTDLPELARCVSHLFVSGGAVWTHGNVTDAAEFNFYRDPQAAALVLSSGLPITVAPLDVSRLVGLDESHVARLSASGCRTGESLAGMLRYPLEQDCEPGYGKTLIHDALACGCAIWPDLFIKTRMRLDIETQGAQAGRSIPALGGDQASRVDLLTAVNAVDFLENALESLCQDTFVV